ncbi:MAG: hypothetical protein EOM64_05545 [Erysipelotrichia bacterium]|nr:hypothetical protein [Erysipelotrichia bacterium]
MTNENSRNNSGRNHSGQQHRSSSSQHSSNHKNGRKLNKLNLWTVILVVLVCIEMIVALCGVILLNSMMKDTPTLNMTDFYTTESSHIFDKDGNEIADVGTTIRENVEYNDLSEAIIDAFLATEDSRFFSHSGFDMPRFAKAMVENVLSGSFSQGGSTFTMQLVKLTYFQNDEAGVSKTRNIAYKVQQIALARELEKQSSKKDIFVMYLNRLNFGGSGNIRGIEKASEYYYGKNAGELNLDEAAVLAGVINSPANYDPHSNLTRATSRSPLPSVKKTALPSSHWIWEIWCRKKICGQSWRIANRTAPISAVSFRRGKAALTRTRSIAPIILRWMKTMTK